MLGIFGGSRTTFGAPAPPPADQDHAATEPSLAVSTSIGAPITTSLTTTSTTDRVRSAAGKRKSNGLVNGVVLFLYGGRWHKYFVRECLPRLDRYFLTCFPYPVHVFHEGISESASKAISSGMPHAGRVDFEDVGWVWKQLPAGVTDDKINKWLTEGYQPHFAKKGYRIMCRFWFGIVWTLSSMDKYDYYWRLDTDSIITRPLLVDPFRHVFVERRCEYGFNKLKGENMLVATGILDQFATWASDAKAQGRITQESVDRVMNFAVNKSTGKYWAPMYFNNFEMGSFRLKRSETYLEFFKYIDTHEPYGIFRYRWGDAPLHTIGVVAAVPFDRICNVSQETVGYKHANRKPAEALNTALPLVCDPSPQR